MTTHTARILMILGMLLVATGGVAAATSDSPGGVPHNFYGEVEINGQPAPDGVIIRAEIDGKTFGLGTTEDGRYGYEGDSFYVDDPDGFHDGNEITFYVEDEEAATYTFRNGQSTRLDFSVEMDDVPTGGTIGEDDSPAGGGGGGSPSSGSTTTTSSDDSDSESSDSVEDVTVSGSAECTPDWECSEWTECSNFNHKRVCIDRNGCDTSEGRPALSESCGQPESGEDDVVEQNAGLGVGDRITGFATSASGLGALIFLAGIALIVILVVRRKQ